MGYSENTDVSSCIIQSLQYANTLQEANQTIIQQSDDSSNEIVIFACLLLSIASCLERECYWFFTWSMSLFSEWIFLSDPSSSSWFITGSYGTLSFLLSSFLASPLLSWYARRLSARLLSSCSSLCHFHSFIGNEESLFHLPILVIHWYFCLFLTSFHHHSNILSFIHSLSFLHYHPAGWIDAAHRNSVPILGTIIIEGNNQSLLQQLLQGPEDHSFRSARFFPFTSSSSF